MSTVGVMPAWPVRSANGVNSTLIAHLAHVRVACVLAVATACKMGWKPILIAGGTPVDPVVWSRAAMIITTVPLVTVLTGFVALIKCELRRRSRVISGHFLSVGYTE